MNLSYKELLKVQQIEMENQNLIELKKKVLSCHVEFIKFMLMKQQASELTARLQHMLECITLDKKK